MKILTFSCLIINIKALMSGTLPTFIDAGANFDSYIIDDDSLIKQAHAHNKSVVVLGDDTWLSLFEAHTIAFERTYPSFNIKDLDTNDINVDRELMAILKPTKAVSSFFRSQMTN